MALVGTESVLARLRGEAGMTLSDQLRKASALDDPFFESTSDAWACAWRLSGVSASEMHGAGAQHLSWFFLLVAESMD